jgi:predicted nucleic acid-binding protein
VIYLDSSVVLSQLLVENRRPPEALWLESLVSSRLLQYEIWNRIHARGLAETHTEEVHRFLTRISLLELTPAILYRALDPFPIPLRTLDALHLASLDYVRAKDEGIRLASYDNRMIAAARALGVGLHDL